jgi:hypothetical protein
MVSLLSTKFHEILFSSFRGVALTNCVTDRQTDRRTDGQTDRTKTICLPTKVGGDIKITNFIFGTNAKSMNLRIHELVIFNQTTKIDTQEEKHFHNVTLQVSDI